ncbi:prephenate dehydrogenase/arogenate dehydrogenase family protein [Aestuariivirga sp.]|uniref:prephenate dehydrogenase/arogenate dehydrogenase family protein n=1 Tax=Aestuariivirga sp. TaxID=2650926 RepID=UPI00391881DE
MKRIHRPIRTIGLFGFGAFGRLIAPHLGRHFELLVHDPCLPRGEDRVEGCRFGTLAEAAACDAVILAVPVSEFGRLIHRIAPHLRPGALVADVGSVKMVPARLMEEGLPAHVEVLGTHPLFGPQSAAGGLRNRKITLCPVRCPSARRVAAFLRCAFGLKVYVTSAEEHDREAAVVQGLTHLIAKVLVRMEPLPKRLTTASFDHLMRAVDMVRNDAAGVFDAIEKENPFAAGVRQRFLTLVEETRLQVERRG